MNNPIRGLLALAGYVATIFAANWAIATFGLVPVGFGLMAPAGVYFAGLAFTLRDLTREHAGYWWAISAIWLGAALSAGVAPGHLAFASGMAFLFSETLDATVYEWLRRRGWLGAVVVSNVAGFIADSALFLWLAFGTLDFLAGQVVGKAWMTGAAVLVLWLWRQRDRRSERSYRVDLPQRSHVHGGAARRRGAA